MREPDKRPKYRKHPDQESRLHILNTFLAPLGDQLISRFEKPRLPIVFIVGTPRSGSTLLPQVLARTAAFSHVSNFLARFWMAPYLGMLIQDGLQIGGSDTSRPFVSQYGLTEGGETHTNLATFGDTAFPSVKRTNLKRPNWHRLIKRICYANSLP